MHPSHTLVGVPVRVARRAAIEPNVEVRSQLASSAKRLPAKDALPIVQALLARSDDQHDIHIPLLLWWALEAKVATDPELVLGILSDSETWSLPIVNSVIAERLMRRFAAAGTRHDLATAPAAGPRTRPGPRQAPDGGFRVSLRRPAARGTAARAGRCPREI